MMQVPLREFDPSKSPPVPRFTNLDARALGEDCSGLGFRALGILWVLLWFGVRVYVRAL